METKVCEHCRGALPRKRGRPKRFCSDVCGFAASELAREKRLAAVYGDECAVCGQALPPQTNGRPRTYCSDDCSDYAYNERRARARAYLRENEARMLDAMDMSSGFGIEKPLPRAPVDVNRMGCGDIDLTPFMDEEWCIQFVSEFGTSGAEVGQTYPFAGRTLGSD